MVEKKEIIISTRVNNGTNQQMNNYVKKYKISKSSLIRRAINYYIRFAQKDKETTKPWIIMSKVEFKCMLRCLNRSEIKKLAKRSYFLSVFNRKNDLGIFIKDLDFDSNLFNVKPRPFVSALINMVFKYEGQNWFEDIRYSFYGKELMIAGIHNLGINFSLFIKFFLKNHLLEVSYKLIKEKFNPNKVIFTFEKV
jgi:hypothetical protein